MDSAKQHQTLFWFLNLNIAKAILILLIGCLVFLPISGCTHYKKAQEQKKLAQSRQTFATPARPLVLIHGFDTNTKDWNAAVIFLARYGYKENVNLFRYSYPTTTVKTDRISTLSVNFVAWAKEKFKGGQPFDIIAHSMGGLVARYAIKGYSASDVEPGITQLKQPLGGQVVHLVMLGTPNHGINAPDVIFCGGSGVFCGEAVLDMKTTSEFLGILNRDPLIPGPTKYMTYRASCDERVPEESVILSGADNRSAFSLCNNQKSGIRGGTSVNHGKLVRDTEVLIGIEQFLNSDITEYCNPIQEGYGADNYIWTKLRICLLKDENIVNNWSARVYILDTQYKYTLLWHWPSTKYPYHASITIADGVYINAQSPVKILYGPTGLTGPQGASVHINTLSADYTDYPQTLKWVHAIAPFTWSIIYRQDGPFWLSHGLIQVIGHFTSPPPTPSDKEFCDSIREIYSTNGNLWGKLQMCLIRNRSTGKWKPRINVLDTQYKLNSSWYRPSTQHPYDSIILIREVVDGKPGQTIYGPVSKQQNTSSTSSFTAPDWIAGSSNTSFRWQVIYNQAGPYWPAATGTLQYYPTFTITNNENVQISTAP